MLIIIQEILRTIPSKQFRNGRVGTGISLQLESAGGWNWPTRIGNEISNMLDVGWRAPSHLIQSQCQFTNATQKVLPKTFV